MTAEPLAFHPVADLFPALPPDEYAALVEDIRVHGLIDPIWLYEDQIIDGRHRYRACLECGVPPVFRDWHGEGSLVEFVVSVNVRRRHLTEDQMAFVVEDVARAFAEEAAERKRLSDIKNITTYNATRNGAAPMSGTVPDMGAAVATAPAINKHREDATERAAKVTGVSQRKARAARKVAKKAPELAKRVKAGTLELEEAAKAVRKQEAAEKAAKPKPLVARELLPCILEVADACHLPLEEATVDLIVTSPPYGLDIAYAGYVDLAEGWYVFMVDGLREAYRVMKPGGRLALNVPLDTSEPEPRPVFAEAVYAALVAGWTYRCAIVWNENNISKSTARGSVDSYTAPHVIARVEIIALFSKGDWGEQLRGESDLTREEWLERTDGLWTFPGQSRGWEGHPAPFPEELPRRLITLLSGRGDVVLDPFVGSGTTVLVAHRLGRKAIGYDQSEQYIEAAARRMAASS